MAFGSLLAMLLPIVIAVFGVGTGLFGTQLISHVTNVPELASLLSTLIGLGAGIDYALFIVPRHRRGILRGDDPEEAAVTALDTSGRAVLFAGGTVCIALAGMLVTNLRFPDGAVSGTSLTVVLSVLAAVTLLTSGERQVDRTVSLADGSDIVSVPSPGTYLLAVRAAPYGSRAGQVTVLGGPLVHDVELAPGEVDAVS